LLTVEFLLYIYQHYFIVMLGALTEKKVTGQGYKKESLAPKEQSFQTNLPLVQTQFMTFKINKASCTCRPC